MVERTNRKLKERTDETERSCECPRFHKPLSSARASCEWSGPADVQKANGRAPSTCPCANSVRKLLYGERSDSGWQGGIARLVPVGVPCGEQHGLSRWCGFTMLHLSAECHLGFHHRRGDGALDWPQRIRSVLHQRAPDRATADRAVVPRPSSLNGRNHAPAEEGRVVQSSEPKWRLRSMLTPGGLSANEEKSPFDPADRLHCVSRSCRRCCCSVVNPWGKAMG